MEKKRVGFWAVLFIAAMISIPGISALAEEVAGEEQPPIEVPDGEESEMPSEPAPEQPTQPKKHIVQPGETLWSITSAYLVDPFYWPKLWDANRFIRNPDLIYPGNVIILPPPEIIKGPVEEKVVVPVEPVPVEEEVVEEVAEEEEEPAPVVKAPEKPAPTVPSFTVETAPEAALDLALLASVGYVLAGEINGSSVLVGDKDHKVLLGQNDIVYLRPARKANYKEGDRLLVYRTIRKVHHPKTGKFLGRLVVVLGTLDVLETSPKMTTAKIRRSYNYIQAGDRVAPYEAVRLPSIEEVSAEEGAAAKGYVVDVREEKVVIGQHDVVYIDRGMKDGIGRGSSFRVIREGDKTAYFSPGRGATLPPRIIGELEVVMVNDHTATAKVKRSSETINPGDRIESLVPVE